MVCGRQKKEGAMSVHITTTSPVIIDDVGDEDLISHLRGCLGANGSPLVCVDASALALELDLTPHSR
jgi:hypothetical protein